MAQKDGGSYESYRKDAFDNPPEGPVGVHRGQRSFWVRATPFVIVLVAAVAAGVLFWSIFSGQAANLFRSPRASVTASSTQVTTSSTSSTSDGSSAAGSSSATASDTASASSATESASGSASPSESASASESSTPEESQQVNLGANISVVNGTARQGYASEEASRLTSAGFEHVTPMNPVDMSLPEQTVVWYQDDADLATAQQVANTLGISAVEQSSSIGEPVVVVLMQ
ncbi:MAG: LytR C-terminal domain-containing protein [Bifidobacterium sp.]|nr:LytR C-terminal domain-containing protein [Bifidobacterium sp.]